MAGSRCSSRRAASGERKAGDPARRALPLLCPATFFQGYDQGYDDLVLGLSLPLIAAELRLSAPAAGLAVSVIQAGSFGLLLLLPLADRVGRRPVLLWTIAGYTLATVATAGSRGAVELVAFLAVATLGLSWRALYAVGAAPLAVVAAARRRLPEMLPAGGPGEGPGHAGGPAVPRAGSGGSRARVGLRGSPHGPTGPWARAPGRAGLRGLPGALADAGVPPRRVVAASVLSFLFAV